jgi:hypothetical protein
MGRYYHKMRSHYILWLLTLVPEGPIYARKGICVLAGNDFNATGISDALVGMGEATHPEGRKLFPKAKPAGGF